jgi:hypothetical protein
MSVIHQTTRRYFPDDSTFFVTTTITSISEMVDDYELKVGKYYGLLG